MTTNYLQIMIDSLKKKKDILDKIIVLNETQNKILSNTEFDHDVFENNMHEKGECIVLYYHNIFLLEIIL
jgi:hypothetical protein